MGRWATLQVLNVTDQQNWPISPAPGTAQELHFVAWGDTDETRMVDLGTLDLD
jgi:hypothetical protein